MKKLYWIIIAVLGTALAVSVGIAAVQSSHLKSLKAQVAEQSAVIDSLLTRRMTVFDVHLDVTTRAPSRCPATKAMCWSWTALV